MSIIIGGPPSTGSSLLSRLLDRHSQIACFQETHLFAKHQLYQDWENYKNRILSGRLMSAGWHMYNAVDLPIKLETDALINKSDSLCDFANKYFSAAAAENHKLIWAEKTPLNIYFFDQIRSELTTTRFILTIRNPYDTVASLILRGKSVLDAVALTLLNLGIGYLQSIQVDMLTVRYEDLVRHTEDTVQNICDYINVDFEMRQLDPNSQPTIKMAGWKHYEDGQIQTSSVDRFKELSRDIQKQVLHLSHKVRINTKHLDNNNIDHSPLSFDSINLHQLVPVFDYPQIDDIDVQSQALPSLLSNRLYRLFKLHPTGLTYPVYYE